jgi:RES domain-containing protein
MRVLLGNINNNFEEIDSLEPRLGTAILDKKSYVESRKYAMERRINTCNGFSYPSVRDERGRCIAAFWPTAVGIPVQERHLQYDWNGQRVTRYFDFKFERWFRLD